VISHDVKFSEDTAEVVFDSDRVSVEEIEVALDGIGYRPKSTELLGD
jgi:copper chaperone CopZ